VLSPRILGQKILYGWFLVWTYVSAFGILVAEPTKSLIRLLWCET